MITVQSSRRLARTWPYPRHRDFERALRQSAATWFAGHGFAVNARFSYILSSREQWPENIIDQAVVSYIQAERALRETQGQGFPLHKYVHHGLSSQAMLFNLIGPLIVHNDLDILQDVFARQGVLWPAGIGSADFEYEDRAIFNEDTGQPTSIDLVLKNHEGLPRVFIEAKLVEKKFGGCSVFAGGDCDGRNPASDFSLCYLHHIGRTYWTLLEKYGFLEGVIGTDSTCILATYYQFFREVLFALEYDGAFVLLGDERSPVFDCHGPAGRRGLMAFLLSLVPAQLHERIGMISIQQIAGAVKASGRHPWLMEFEQKYGLGEIGG